MVVMENRSLPSRVVLRLDNGSLIGSGASLKGDPALEAVRLSVAEAFDAGRVRDTDVQRLQGLLAETPGASAPGAKYASGSGLKRKDADAFEASLPDAKRSRPRQSLPADGRREAHSDASRGSSWNGDFVEKSLDIVQKLFDALGHEKQWFDRPVDEFYIPGYYKKVKNPMDLGTVKDKLDRGRYKNPSDFCEDVRLVWSNCIFFNGKGSHYGRIGDRMSSMFEELWAGSGLDTGSSRHRRATAGVAAPKYEPLEEEKKPLRKAPSMRAQNHSRSTKVREDGAIPMDRDQMNVLAEWMGELDEGPELTGAVDIIKEHGFGPKEGPEAEEWELDFDAMDNETLWALDDWMVQMKGGKRESVGAQANSGFQVEPESDYDSESADSE